MVPRREPLHTKLENIQFAVAADSECKENDGWRSGHGMLFSPAFPILYAELADVCVCKVGSQGLRWDDRWQGVEDPSIRLPKSVTLDNFRVVWPDDAA